MIGDRGEAKGVEAALAEAGPAPPASRTEGLGRQERSLRPDVGDIQDVHGLWSVVA